MNAIFTFPFRRPALFFLIWAGWLSLEYWALGPFSYLFIHDNADQVIPFMTWLTRSPLALWRDPLVPVVSGLDRFSSTAWLVAHQPFLMTLPLWLGHGVFIALQRFLAGYFTYRFLREGLRLPPAVGLLAGLAYTLIQAENGELRMMHVFNEPGLPVLLWGFSCIPARPWKAAVPRYVLISLMIGLGMGPVDAMPFFIPVAWLVGWILRDDTRNIRGWLSYTAWITATCLLALPWKIPGIQALLANAEISHRVDWVNGLGWSDAIWHLLPGRVGWLAGWWLPLLLSLAWVIPFWRWRRRADLASLLLLFAGVALGTLVQVVVYVKSADLGIFKGINWFRFDRIGPLALLIAAGMGVRRMFYAPWEEANWQPGRLLVLGLLGGLIVHESWTVKQSHLAAVKTGQHWRALFDNADVKRLASSQRGKPLRVVTAAANHEYHAMYNLAYGLECADGYAVLYPERYQRYWREVVRPLLTREPGLAGHFTWGSRAYLYHGQSPVNASVAAIPFADWYNLDLLSLANVGQVISRKPVNDPRLVRVPPVWSEEKRDAWAEKPLRAKLKDYLSGDNPGSRAHVYENPSALARCFFTPGSRVFDHPDALYAALGQASLTNLSRQVYLIKSEAPGVVDHDPAPGAAQVTIDTYQPSELRATVVAEKPGFLVCSNTFYPWWLAEVDGKPAPILPAYGAFMAVRLPSGTHTIRWVYRPPYQP